MKSTKYRLLDDDFKSLQRDSKIQKELIEQLREENKELCRFRELTKMFKYAVEHTQDFSEFYHYMSDIAYGKSFDDLKK